MLRRKAFRLRRFVDDGTSRQLGSDRFDIWFDRRHAPDCNIAQVCHFVNKDYRCVDYFNDVDKDSVPVPHYGVVLTVEQFKSLADRVKAAGIKFLVVRTSMRIDSPSLRRE